MRGVCNPSIPKLAKVVRRSLRNAVPQTRFVRVTINGGGGIRIQAMSRRAGLRRVMRRDPDYTVLGKVTTPHGGVVPEVPCRVYLPRSAMGRPYLEFDVSESQSGPLAVPEFSVECHAETPNGVVSIRSDIVLTQGWSAEHWGSKFIKCTLPGEPWDLEITKRGSESDNSVIQNGIFWLSPNRLLNPRLMSLFSYTGAVEMKTARELAFQLPAGLVHFRTHFHQSTKNRRCSGRAS